MSTSFPQIDKSKYYTKTETHAQLDALALGEYKFANAYYNKDYIDELGEQYYLKAEVDALIAAIEGGVGGSVDAAVCAIVPNGSTYSFGGGTLLQLCAELR